MIANWEIYSLEKQIKAKEVNVRNSHTHTHTHIHTPEREYRDYISPRKPSNEKIKLQECKLKSSQSPCHSCN